MKRNEYIHGSTRIRVFEKRLLPNPIIERMVESNSIEEALKILGETDYSNSLNRIEKPEEFEMALANESQKLYRDIVETSQDPNLGKFLTLKYVYHNLKTLTKEHVLGEDLSDLLIDIGTMDYEKYRNFLETSEIKSEMDFPITGMKEAITDYKETQDPQRIDIIFDKYYFLDLLETAGKIGSPVFVEYVKNLIDLTNLRTLLRAKRQQQDVALLKNLLIDGGNMLPQDLEYSYNDTVDVIKAKTVKLPIFNSIRTALDKYARTGSLTDFEKAMDDYTMRFAVESSKVLYGPEVMFGYGMRKEAEIRNLRIILVSKLNRIPTETLRERLRELYV